MSILKKIHTNNVIFEYKIDNKKTKQYDLHCHNYYQISYTVSGDVSCIVEGKSYSINPNSILLLRPNIFHGVKIESYNAYERYSLHFSNELISSQYRDILLSVFDEKNSAYFENADHFNLKLYLDNIAESSDFINDISDTILKIRIESLLTQILFMNSCKKKYVYSDVPNDTVSSIINYINDNFTKDISLNDICMKFYISRHHLNMVFKKNTGTTVGNYIIYKRVANARKLMSEGYYVSAAAFSSGFHDYSAFFKAYKKIFGYHPSNDRKKEALY